MYCGVVKLQFVVVAYSGVVVVVYCIAIHVPLHLLKEIYRVTLLAAMGRCKSRGGKSQRRRRPGRKEDAGARKNGKVAGRCFLPMVCGSGGLAKAAGAEPSGQIVNKVLHAVAARRICGSQWIKHRILGPHLEVDTSKQRAPPGRKAHVEVKGAKNRRVRGPFLLEKSKERTLL